VAVRRRDKTGKTLELQVADRFRALGAKKVEHDVELAGNQIDVYVELEIVGRFLHRVAVEAKDWNKLVGVDIVNRFVTVVKVLHDAKLIDEGIIVSTSGFSRPARNAAKTHGIQLLDLRDICAYVPLPPPVPLEEKLSALGDRRRDAQVVCLGSVYLDLELRPVDMARLNTQGEEEWTNVKSRLRRGGSSWYVYQCLDELGCETWLATKIGDESHEFFAERHLRPLREALARSVDKPSKREANKNRTALTVHLIECSDFEGKEPIATTMLTDTGALKSLRWDDDEIQQVIGRLDEGGVLYLSGYFKTALHEDLQSNLESLDRANVIICLDHGRFRPGIVELEQIKALRESIKCADTYFCTTHEMKQLFDTTLAERPWLKEYGSLEQVLKFLDKQLGPKLPEVILVRDNKGQEDEQLTVTIKSDQERVYASIPVRRVRTGPERFVGVPNAFHARFVHRMLNDERCENLIPAIIEWALCAQRMMEGVMRGEEPKALAEKCNKCERCVQVARDWWADTSRPLPLFDCPTTPGGEYANT
jgi:sugar/nucleoside kinase (ribokinase family)